MKVVVVTALTPTPENRGGISALIYSILRFRPDNVKIKVYSFNLNKISQQTIDQIGKELSSTIELLEIPSSNNIYKNKWLTRFDKFFRKTPLSIKLFTKKVLSVLNNEDCDFFYLYPYQMCVLTSMLPHKRFLISAPDSYILIRSRSFNNPFRLHTSKMIFDDCIYLKKYINIESQWNRENLRVHFVGMEDFRFYRDVTGNNNAHFLLHPFVKYVDKSIDFSSPKLKVIIPGSYDMYYQTDVDKMIPSLLKFKKELLKSFDFTFLGKQWGTIDKLLKGSGFECEFKTWVDDYAEELVSHDIMIAPVSFGTGTKGKVLDAMVNGLLVIGSDYALENICVRDMDSCVRYRDASHIASILLSVANHRERYQLIAEKGRKQVLTYHDPVRISNRFFSIYYNELNG